MVSFSPVTASIKTGNKVPQRTAKQLASRMRLLNRKLDSRETTLSSLTSLRKYLRLARIAVTVRTMAVMRNVVKYGFTGDCAKACTDDTRPVRVSVVPKMLKRNVAETSTIFQTFIMPFFSCIMTEWRNAVAVIHGMSEAFSTGSQPQ